MKHSSIQAAEPAGLLAERETRLTATRNMKMARSSHAYVRGSTVQFYQWLQEGDASLPHGPDVWICGDCHIGNLGPVADVKNRIAIQIRDLDQTVIGNPAHDIVRLGLSLASAARGSDLPGTTTVNILEHLVAGYSKALGGNFEAESEKPHRSRSIQAILAQSERRDWQDLATERLEGGPRFPIGKRFWTLSAEERDALGALIESEAVRQLLTKLHGRDDDAPVRMVDAAYWLKGCSSLGRLRYAVLVRIGDGRRADMAVVDVKEAVEAAAPSAPGGAMPEDDATRVVSGARMLSPYLGNRMLATTLLGRSVVLRELMPQDLKIDVNRLSSVEGAKLAHYLGGVVGRAHGRQVDATARRDWLKVLGERRTSSLEAPSWLWTSVVELIGQHEAAYLEHCRRHAFAGAEAVR